MRATRVEDFATAADMSEDRYEDRYWMGFAAGALIGTAAAVAGFVLTNALSGRSDSRVLRLEDSIQIGRPVEEVFAAWQNFEKLPQYIDVVQNVRVNGNHSEWLVTVDGKDFRWSAETTQVIPNQSIGWKSVEGPKHSGRLTFSRIGDRAIGDQTLLHVTMNYAPPLGRLGMLLSPLAGNLEGQIAGALRSFKNAIEGNREGLGVEASGARKVGDMIVGSSNPARAQWREAGTRATENRATGTHGGSIPERQTGPVGSPNDNERSGFVNYTRPPKPKYP